MVTPSPLPVAASSLPLQSFDPATGPIVAFVGTFVATALFLSATAHVAARNVLGDVPIRRALAVGPVPAAAVVALAQHGPGVTLVVTGLADLLAVHVIYRVRYRTAGLVTVIHVTISFLLTLALGSLIALLGTAPT
ncbi:hypothetical protein BRD17_03150 [Halobacteriales archaeon SW_7_68_16]|nr:MAG: hypothetical protein BRD17_03150 [Halobacteriales archaeon SW_7_68_16]